MGDSQGSPASDNHRTGEVIAAGIDDGERARTLLDEAGRAADLACADESIAHAAIVDRYATGIDGSRQVHDRGAESIVIEQNQVALAERGRQAGANVDPVRGQADVPIPAGQTFPTRQVYIADDRSEEH